jgi:hypothetical protein
VKKPKPWRLVKAWHPHEWAPFKEAWQRAEAVIGSSLWLMKRDLRQDFLDGRLIAAVRRISLDGTETRVRLDPTFWQQLKINYAWSITGWGAEAREGEHWVFVVRRRELDSLYPIATLGPPAADAKPSAALDTPSEPEEARPTPQRRRPGPPPNKEWDKIVVRELLNRARAGQKLPMSPEMLKFCGEKLDWEPDPRAMQRLLRLFADPELWRLLTEALK